MGLRNRILASIKRASVVALAVLLTAGMLPSALSCQAFAGSKDSIGQLKWARQIPYESIIESADSPVYYNGHVFIASGERLYRFGAETGQEEGEADIAPGVGSNKLAPTLTEDGRLLLALKGTDSSDPALAVVDAETMDTRIIEYSSGQEGYQSLTSVAYDPEENCAYLGSFKFTVVKHEDGSRENVRSGCYARVELDRLSEEGYQPEILTEDARGFYWSGACTEGDFVVFGSLSSGTDDPRTPTSGNASVYAYSKATGRLARVTIKGSGSICSTPVYYKGAYYLVSKGGRLYRAVITEKAAASGSGITISCKALVKTSCISTCTPDLDGSILYFGGQKKGKSRGIVYAVNLKKGKLVKSYYAPADVKALTVCRLADDNFRVYCTYNNAKGGIYEVTAGYCYYLPDAGKQGYCISSIAMDGNDSTLYYMNDSCWLMAVGKEQASFKKPARLSRPTVSRLDDGNVTVTWTPKGGETGFEIQRSKYKSKKYSTVSDVDGSTSSCQLSAPAGRAFYYRIRAYRIVGSYRIAGAWSRPKKFTLKRQSL